MKLIVTHTAPNNLARFFHSHDDKAMSNPRYRSDPQLSIAAIKTFKISGLEIIPELFHIVV